MQECIKNLIKSTRILSMMNIQFIHSGTVDKTDKSRQKKQSAGAVGKSRCDYDQIDKFLPVLRIKFVCFFYVTGKTKTEKKNTIPISTSTSTTLFSYWAELKLDVSKICEGRILFLDTNRKI